MEEPEPRRSKWISILQAFAAFACDALEQWRFCYHTPEERSQYFQRPSGALLGQVVLQRRSPLLEIRGFPYWLTIPGLQWLAMARRWHFFFAWLLVVNGIAFVTYSILSRHLHRDLVPTGQDWRSIGRSIFDHLRFRHATGEAAKHYNVLQKFAYLAVIFFLLPLMILMGLGMSPALDALSPGWVDIFFGRQFIRTIHFVIAWALVLFVIVHVFEVIVTGFWNNLRSMITGYYRVGSEVDYE